MNATYDGRCKVTELVFVRYTVRFRPGMTFAVSMKRIAPNDMTYLERCRNDYEVNNPGATHCLDEFAIVSIQNGWR